MKHYVQLAAIRGNVDVTDSGSRIVKDDFYTMVMENSEGNKGIRQIKIKGDTGTVTPTFTFNSEDEQNNFINFLKTKFARFCLSILKNSTSTYAGEFELIPWLDFTKKWDDEELFKYFDVNEETQRYIREFLPEFHGVRK